MAPMTRVDAVNGNPSHKLSEYYIRRSKGGVGLIIIESAAVDGGPSQGYRNGLLMTSASHAESWKPIIEAIHKEETKIWMQIFHAGRLTVPEITKNKILAPSAIAPENQVTFWRPSYDGKIVHFQTKTPFSIPKEMTQEEIKQTIQNFVCAAKLAESAGFDGIEIHAAHGYLLHEFICLRTNQRNDEYGNLSRPSILLEVINGIKESISPSMTISLRLSLHMIDQIYIRMDDNSIHFSEIIPLLQNAGIDVFHSSELDVKKPALGSNKTLHETLRKFTQNPLIICGRMDQVDSVKEIPGYEQVDLYAYGRSFLNNPNLPELLTNGKRFLDFEYERDFDKIW